MGYFEERTPKLRRAVKYLLTIVIVCAISIVFDGRISMMTL